MDLKSMDSKYVHVTGTAASKKNLASAPKIVFVGYAFTTDWACEGGVVCWITLLVASSDYRQQGIATKLLQFIKWRAQSGWRPTRLMASCPPTLLRAGRLLGLVVLPFKMSIWISCVSTLARSCGSSPASSIWEILSPASPCLNRAPHSGHSNQAIVSCVYTGSLCDLTEPLTALASISQRDRLAAWNSARGARVSADSPSQWYFGKDQDRMTLTI